MKRIALLSVFALFVGGMSMMAQDAPQHPRRGNDAPDPKVVAERMTERMAKEYSLNDEQKQQLLEANQVLMEKTGNFRHAPRRRPHKGEARPERKDRPQLTDEQREQRKAEFEKRRAEMETARKDYETRLQSIMTKEQYEAYNQKQKERKAKMEERKKDRRK